jgi:hypothetical protein
VPEPWEIDRRREVQCKVDKGHMIQGGDGHVMRRGRGHTLLANHIIGATRSISYMKFDMKEMEEIGEGERNVT